MVYQREIYQKRKIKMNKDEQAMWNRLKEPAPIISLTGTHRWYNKDGKLHRDNDLPAVIWEDGSKFWWVSGEKHRENDMPAVIYSDGYKTWWVNGLFIRKNW